MDFLVGHEAFIQHPGGIVTPHPALPIGIDGIPVDAVPIPVDTPFLSEALTKAIVSEGIPVVPVEARVCMKLLALRPRDRRDLEELVRAGVDARKVREYVATHLSALLEDYDELVAGAER